MSSDKSYSPWGKIKNAFFGISARLRTRTQRQTAPLVIKRSQHSISRDLISKNALKVLYRLKNEGYDAFLVGGGVRDILLGFKPKDFDIATNATPEQIKKCFRNCRLIGRRFRLAHVFFQDDIIEVATFRGTVPSKAQQHEKSASGMLIRDNVYGNIREDAWRRDFTVNALYYDISDFSIRDYVDGMHDLQRHEIRLIGTPVIRYREDPVRILRAIRLSSKLNMKIHPDTDAPIHKLAHLMADVSNGRMFEEFKKMFLSGSASEIFEKLKHYGLLEYVLPQTSSTLDSAKYLTQYDFIHISLKNTDRRIKEERPVTIGYLLATLLWYPVLAMTSELVEEGLPKMPAFEKACRKVISAHTKVMSLPRFVTANITEIWHLQMRLNQAKQPKALRIIEHTRFKAAYDFLLLRADAGEQVKDIATWWTSFYEAEPHARKQMVHSRHAGPSRRRRSRSHRRPVGNENQQNDAPSE